MTTQEKIDDLKIEIETLGNEPTDDYWPQWEKDRDIESKQNELNSLIASRI